jgi:hypothetical protein
MVGNIVDVGWATIKSGCLPITASLDMKKVPQERYNPDHFINPYVICN